MGVCVYIKWNGPVAVDYTKQAYFQTSKIIIETLRLRMILFSTSFTIKVKSHC